MSLIKLLSEWLSLTVSTMAPFIDEKCEEVRDLCTPLYIAVCFRNTTDKEVSQIKWHALALARINEKDVVVVWIEKGRIVEIWLLLQTAETLYLQRPEEVHEESLIQLFQFGIVLCEEKEKVLPMDFFYLWIQLLVLEDTKIVLKIISRRR